ncbi:hypothetical protein [Streptomyces poriticola]|uniref:hypothetical protein n=1 Tax=Streptomyces poriticola TaxID=3120506 RepID=UPI002FCE1F98
MPAAEPRAGARFEALDRTERYRVMLGVLRARTAQARAARGTGGRREAGGGGVMPPADSPVVTALRCS